MLIWNQDNLIKTWNCATHAHNGQLVPGSDLPYIKHIGSVVMEIMTAITITESIQNPDLAVKSAILHDTLEDTPTTYQQLEQLFGHDVASGVQSLTKDEKLPSKKEQMQDSLARIKQQPIEIWMVKLADRITNLQPPPSHWTKEKIRNYYQESKLILSELVEANQYLATRLQSKIEGYQKYCL